MNKKFLAVLAASAVLGVAAASATPQTTFEKGQWQLDLGAQNVKGAAAIVDSPEVRFGTDSKWNFNGGLTYGLSDKTALQYRYHGLNTGNDDQIGDAHFDGKEHEINLVQSLNKNFAVFAGWNRISADLVGVSGGVNYEANAVNSNVAQLGVIAKTNLGSKVEAYALGALGTKHTSIWEAGLGYKATKDLDLNVGYRYVNTQLNKDELQVDEGSATFKGLTLGLSYRFGGSKAEPMAPVVEPVAEVVTPASPAPVVEAPKADYYLNSIYFDVDQSNIKSSEVAKADQFVAVAKANPTHIFKISGNTDSDASSEYNMALSQRRVATVAQYAIDRGVSPDQLRAMYNGENKPAADNNTAAGKAENRRVDLWENK